MKATSIKLLLPIASLVCLLTGQLGGGWSAAEGLRCPIIGSAYRPNPDDRRNGNVFRLKIEGTSIAEDPTQSDQNWHFQMLDRNGREIVESILSESCPIGGLCTIASVRVPTDYVRSTIVELTDDLRMPSDLSAPEVIVLPGFRDQTWHIGRDLKADRSLRNKVIWIRISCGG